MWSELPYSALVDASTSALLTLTQRVHIISFLEKTPMDAEHMYSVNYPNYIQRFEIADEPVESFPEWSWNASERLFVRTPERLLTESLRQRSLLAVKKSYVLFEIMNMISSARITACSGIAMQESVYMTKKTQAQRYKDAGYPGGDLFEYPYVLQYADLVGLSMRTAADEILFKARLSDDVLLKSEFFRLKYFELLKNAMEVALIDSIFIAFQRDFYKSGSLV